MTEEDLTAVRVLESKRQAMKIACAAIGEPCIELPMLELKAYKDADGFWHTIIGMDQLIYLVDELLRRP